MLRALCAGAARRRTEGVRVSDLTTKLTEASATAIRKLMPAIEADPANVAAITVEIRLAGEQTVKGATAWIERRFGARDLGPAGEGRG
jgi:hypothetical protein